jgi:YidC/Oxa1 family membrane protein insertase
LGALWEQYMVQPLAQGLTLLAGLTGSYGWAIVLFTIIVKLVLLPLSIKQQQSMRRLQELQPQLQALQKKYAKDKEKLAQEQMRLYREARVNPAGGCLPLLIQMPILLGIWQAITYLQHHDGFNAGFLWLPSLALSEHAMWSQGVWPVLTVLNILTQWVLQRMMTTPTQDPQQQMMQTVMQLMPIYIGWLAFSFPAALALYWLVSNIFGIVQQFIFTGWGTLLPAHVRLPRLLRGGYLFPPLQPAPSQDGTTESVAGVSPGGRQQPGGQAADTSEQAGVRRREQRRSGVRR